MKFYSLLNVRTNMLQLKRIPDITIRYWSSLSSTTGEGHGTPLQYPCLGNPMDRGAWWAAVHAVAKSWACLTA